MNRLEGFGGLLNQFGGGSLLDDVLSPQPTNVGRGDDVLGSIFGSRDVSRAVAQNAASSTELDPALLRKMLPMLAMLAAGFMARQSNTRAASHSQPSSTGGGLGGLLGSLMGGGGTTGVSTGGTGGLASMLDMDGDGNPLDDILNMVGKARG